MSDWRTTDLTSPPPPATVDDIPTVQLRLFAAAREAAGTGRVELQGTTVAEVVERAKQRFGPPFGAIVAASRVWLNGEPADDEAVVRPGDEVAVLPPVSGGADP